MNENHMDLTVIKQIAQKEMADKRSSPYNECGDKFFHGQRVAKIAVEFRKQLFPLEHRIDGILTVAAWFHDICNNGGGRDYRAIHAKNGAIRTKELLVNRCEEDELRKICDIIANHDDRITGAKSVNVALKIHQDADQLDHFGSLGVWKFVCYSVGHNNSIESAMSYIKSCRSSEEAGWLGELHFELSRKIMKEKLDYERDYFKRLTVEGAGEIF